MATSDLPIQVNAPYVEMTFGIIKTHIVRAHQAGVVLEAILDASLTIASARQIELTGETIYELFGRYDRKPYWRALVSSVSGPVVAMVLTGRNVVTAWQELLGSVEDISSLRGRLGSPTTNDVMNDVAYASQTVVDARLDIRTFFPSVTLLLPPDQRGTRG